MALARYAPPQPATITLGQSRIIKFTPAVTTSLSPAGLDRTGTRAQGSLSVTATLPIPVRVTLQGAANGLVVQQVPQPAPQAPKDPAPGVFVFVYSAPPIFNVIVPGATNQGYKFFAATQPAPAIAARSSRIVQPARQTATTLNPAGLQHTRGQGNPAVNPGVAPAGQQHTRGQGSITVTRGAKRQLGNLTVTVAWVPRPSSLDRVLLLTNPRAIGDPVARGHQTITTIALDRVLALTRRQGIPTLSGRALPPGISHARQIGTIEVNLVTLTPLAIDRAT